MIAAALAGLEVDIASLHTLESNPRRGDVDAVARSLDRFGQRKPVVVRASDNTVIAGNHTLTAALSLGWTRLAAVFTDDDEATAKAYALADNRTSALGGFDDVELAAMVLEVREFDASLLEAASFTERDVASLRHKVDGLPDMDEPEAEPLPDDPVTREGDVWEVGPHRVVCGDARDGDAYRLALGGQQADAVWTDPPYGVGYVGKTPDELRIDNDDDGIEALLRDSLPYAVHACRPGATWYVCSPQGLLMHVFGSVLRDLGVWRQTLVWVKSPLVLGHSDYHYRHEPIFYGWVEGAAHVTPPARDQDSVWECARPHASEEHPTMKPLALIARALHNSTIAGAVVLDPFCGSGGVGAVAARMSRRAALIDIDPRYVDVAVRSLRREVGVTPLRNGEPHDLR